MKWDPLLLLYNKIGNYDLILKRLIPPSSLLTIAINKKADEEQNIADNSNSHAFTTIVIRKL